MYEKILIPTDGSEGADTAVAHGLDLSERYNAELHVLYVVDVRLGTASDIWSQMLGNLEEAGRKSAEKIADKARRHDIPAEASAEYGVPHAEIKAYAEEKQIDLIVMGTHGRTGIDRMLLGSVAEKTVRTSEIPVMTVRRSDS